MGKKFLINGVIILAAVGAATAVTRKPWEVYRTQNRETTDRVHEMSDAEKHSEQLLRTEARLQSSIGREELVRKAGFLKDGEKPADQDKTDIPARD